MTPSREDLWLLPLGGTGEIGINMNLYGHAGHWLMVDCGVGFDRRPGGTDVSAADATFIAARRQQLAGLLITHAHEDHVGAVAHHWPELRCPVYCTAFTAAILQRKLAEAGLLDAVPLQVVTPGTELQLGPFAIEWLDLTHSIPESQGLVIRTSAGSVFHTGDWKLDEDPVVGADYNRARLQSLAGEDILAMVCDSTNATLQGRSHSESELHSPLHAVVRTAPGDTLIMSSRVIPGNEEAVAGVLERLQARGVNVVLNDGSAGNIHASGHPASEELLDMYRWLQPGLVVPVHGEARHMRANAALAKAAGVPCQLTGNNGDLFQLAPQPGIRRSFAPVGRVVVRAGPGA